MVGARFRAREAGSPIGLGPLSACRWAGIRWAINAGVDGANDEADDELIGLASAVQSARSRALLAPSLRGWTVRAIEREVGVRADRARAEMWRRPAGTQAV